MRVVRAGDDLDGALAASRREGRAAFGDDRLVLERLVEHARHVEVQVLFDGHGKGIHLGERDCSIQRRHQKVLEETPSPAVDAALRRRLTDAALALARSVGYVSAGTCEFLLADDGSFYFLEMNTRLQVEHPVTEAVTGRDLVADQIRIATGDSLGLAQADVDFAGHAIEARLYAEDPDHGFLPATGTIARLAWPAGPSIRIDAGIAEGTEISDRFDPMLAKVVAHGATRAEALARLAEALDQTILLGVTTNLAFLRWLVRRPEVLAGEARIDTLDRIWPPVGEAPAPIPDDAWSLAAAAFGGGWRLNAAPVVRLEADRHIRTAGAGDALGSGRAWVRVGDEIHVDVGGRSIAFRRAPAPDVDRAARSAAAHGHAGGPVDVIAPMPGSVVSVHVAAGASVDAGDPIATLEAMKMEHAVTSPIPGIVTDLRVSAGDQVARGSILATVEPEAVVPPDAP